MSKLTSREEINLFYIQNPKDFWVKARAAGIEVNDDTRQTFCDMGPEMAYKYAREIEESSHDLTREVASRDPSLAWQYAWFIDDCPHIGHGSCCSI